MTRQELEVLRNTLFTKEWNLCSENIEEIKYFCNFLYTLTGVQCCNILGQVNEHIEKVYNSVLVVIE